MTAWPQVVDRLLAVLPALPSWSQVTVYDGLPLTQDAPTDYVTVGYSDGEEVSGSGDEDTSRVGDIRAENGVVRSDLVCWSGDNAMPSLRARAFALFGEFHAAVRKDSTLGLPGVTATVAFDVTPHRTTGGDVFRLVLIVNYTALSG